MPRTPEITLPDLTGRRTLVTGASDGVGVEIALRLARSGASVVMPVRNPAKGRAAADRIRREVPGAAVDVRGLDLSSLDSVRTFAHELVAQGEPIHALIHNAGVMTPPERVASADGFELQLATNHLGPVALTARLWPLLVAGKARVTSQISVSADRNAVLWDDMSSERGYHAHHAYSSSKIALGLFAMDLDRRSRAAGWG
ncbi:SDR family oxidoreductase [Litorihabitans aurantiacus]|uniref:SDR family NAD(P)-dependent oxidoreductase n=1 Tax=Litorihabitans aurantiacus TaxID=1930061 RepID=A0AA37XH88_9MICO|nr:hypothetical protein GCM10025875_30060 [Litorihabitans aurantiacus]